MNYPNGIKREKSCSNHYPINFQNRGMNLEHDLNDTNLYYREKEKAFIYKKPTPIKLVKVDYKKGRIDEAYFEMHVDTDEANAYGLSNDSTVEIIY